MAMTGLSEALATHGSWEYDPATGAVRWDESMFRLHGVSRGEFAPTVESVRALLHPDDRDEYRRLAEDGPHTGNAFTLRYRIIRPAGDIRALLVRGSVLPAEDGSRPVCVGTTEDVTSSVGFDDQLWVLANEDPLTGLFNRRRFLEELEREVAAARRSSKPGAVLMLDLDRFKEVNDSLGHSAGDRALVAVADTLRNRLRTTDTIGRLGGDEFAVVLPDCGHAEARRVAQEIGGAVGDASALTIAGHERRMTTSIGIAPYGSRADEHAGTLLVEADLAMYRAKRTHSGTIEVFDEEMRAELAARLRTEAELRVALEEDQFRVVYQPIVSLVGGAPVGCEALARWDHPVRGTVGPDEFIPVAEEHDLIGAIGEILLRRACKQAAQWRRARRNLYVSVNVSPRQLVRSDIASAVREALAGSGLPAPLLCLEMTETSLLEDARPMKPALEELRRIGVRLAIDDFGGGSSSFALLRLLPLDLIKIDRVFIEGVSERADDRAIVAAVISLAEELDLHVIAEGIETSRQHAELRELGCRFGQGFLYERPPARTASTRSSGPSCAARTAVRGSRTPAIPAASRSIRAGRSARTARRRRGAPRRRSAAPPASAAARPPTSRPRRLRSGARPRARRPAGPARAPLGRAPAATATPRASRPRRVRPARRAAPRPDPPAPRRSPVSRTLILIKPDAFERGLTGEILARFERKGLRITAMRLLQADEEIANRHYAEHTEKPFFGELVSFITGGPLVAAVLEGHDAVTAARQLIGATNPLEATPGSIRGDYALEVTFNMVHGSDSDESAAREIGIWFPEL
jgi:diguanylate cyclase (GGDEF)-like protein